MTNTKFRKRALLSSVAMLLVALVALGSATFAWFTENPTATAQGITAYAQTSTGITIETDTDKGAGKHSADFMKSAALVDNAKPLTLVPAYLVSATNNTALFLATEGTDRSTSAPKTGATWGAVNTLTGAQTYYTAGTKFDLGEGVYREDVYIKTTNGTAADTINLTGLTIQAAGTKTTIGDCVTVAVVVGNEVKAKVKLGAGTFGTFTTTPAQGDSVSAAGTAEAQTTVSAASPVALGTGNYGTNALKISFYVYLDGTDARCITDNADISQQISSITATFAKA